MLVARRDPPFQSGAHDARMRPACTLATPRSPTRFMTALQVIGSLLAIPVGLASAYSIYHANFSAEAQCQSLRANIIAMLDKSADASTLRMLVRRDVEVFETTCGAVDPDAVAAFKMLLAAQDGGAGAGRRDCAAAAGGARAGACQSNRPKPAEPKAARRWPKPKPVQRDAAASDANWIASVREALIHYSSRSSADAALIPPRNGLRRPVVQPVAPQPLVPFTNTRVAGAVADAAGSRAGFAARSGARFAACRLGCCRRRRPRRPRDHPVPPGSIPIARAAAGRGGRDARSFRHRPVVIAKIPLVNRVVGR